MKKKLIIVSGIVFLLGLGVVFYCFSLNGIPKKKVGKYEVAELILPSHKCGKGKNQVRGVVLHHTATFSVSQSLDALCYNQSQVSCHVLIDRDGTRYILAPPETVTFHAGYSALNGRNWCNNFTIGIEFQGNTLQQPLTDDQINSAIDYLLPIIKKYKIPLRNIVTHEQVNVNWRKAHLNKDVAPKIDITQAELKRFIKALKKRREIIL